MANKWLSFTCTNFYYCYKHSFLGTVPLTFDLSCALCLQPLADQQICMYLFTSFSFLSYLFSVRFFQVFYIFAGLVPRILHELFTHHYQKSVGVEWNDSEEQRKTLAAKMREKNVQPKFSHDRVEQLSILDWDVTYSCAALQMVMDPSHPVAVVRDDRNSVHHVAKTEIVRGDLEKSKRYVQKLINEALPCPDFAKEVRDGYLAELDHLTSSEWQLWQLLWVCVLL